MWVVQNPAIEKSESERYVEPSNLIVLDEKVAKKVLYM